MTLEEKIGQMSQIDIPDLMDDDPDIPGKKKLSLPKVKKVIGEHGVGSVLNYIPGKPFTPQEFRQVVVTIQEIAKNYSRPPVIYGLDSVHGANYVLGAAVTSQPINVAATFNTSFAFEAGALASRDTRAIGINWLFSPILGLSVEPKWARVYETFGESPLVVSKMGSSFIRGIQNDSKDKGIPSKAAACAKHFVGYSAPHNGHDRSPSHIPTRHLYQYFLPPWKAAIQDEKVLTVMESYTEYDGVPNVANPSSLRYLLRQQLGFSGLLVTDYEEIKNLKNWHHISSTEKNAVAHTLREGSVDMSMIPHEETGFIESVKTAVAEEMLVEARINQSVERILTLKNHLNMFHEELLSDDPNLHKIGQDKDKAMALEMATQSIILTKNEMKTLPLNAGSTKILVTGPTSNSLVTQCGGWTGEWQGVPDPDTYLTYGTTVLDAMKSKFSAANVKYSCGVDILGNECEDPLDDKVEDSTAGKGVLDQFKDLVGLGPDQPSNSMERAAALAISVDFVVVCIGEEAYTEKPGDIRSLNLPAGQYELVNFLTENTNAKVVLVYFGGRPRLLRQVASKVDAILLAFLPGPSGGQAVVDLIAGTANPSGKLPLTYPMYEDGGGAPYFHSVSDKCTKPNDGQPLPHYDYEPCQVQWGFGHGLSYTVFQYSDLSLSTRTLHYSHPGQEGHLKPAEPLVVSVKVENKGSVAGYETVFFFTFDEYRSTTPEFKILRFFQKIHLQPGEGKTVTASIPIEDFKFVGPHDETHYILEDGIEFRVGIGAETDCRSDDGKNSVWCSDLLTIDAPDYNGACEHACDLWASSGCADQLDLPPKRCWSLCSNSAKNPDVVKHSGEGEDGWGWNYVRCLENVVWGFREGSFDKKKQCPKMTALCRDIFRTNGDSYGHGDVSQTAKASDDPTAVTVALCSGLLFSFLVFYALRVGFQKDARRGEGGIQFSRVSNEDNLTA